MTKKSLLNSLKIQKRVVYALLMREIITRYGRNNIGFLWLILEPMIFTLLFTVMWTIRDMDHVSKLPITIFVLTGYGTMLLWRNTIGRSLSAISSNIGLMYHKNVKPMDIFIARAILEILGTIAAFILIYIIFLWFGLVDQPKDIFKIIGGFFFLVWFAFFGSILIGSLSNLSDIVQKIWSPFSLILMLISGTFFMVEWLPS
ncbi:MAG: ABC transporter permease, partial [Campylobacterales bacterium]|nr:ABC transporter permease [Campylobacterales bacterium]